MDEGNQAPTGEGSGQTGSPGDPTKGNGAPEEVSLTPAQQKLVEKLVNEAFGKGFKKAEAQFEGRIKDLEGKAAQATDKGDKKAQEGTYTQAQVQELIEKALQEPGAKLQAAEQRVQELLHKDRLAAIVSAAAKANVAGDPGEFALLVDRYVRHDEEGRVIVVDEGGAPRLNARAQPLVVDEFVKQYVDARPHLKKGAGTIGAGSGTGNASHTGTGPQGKPKTMQEANAILAKVLSGGKL